MTFYHQLCVLDKISTKYTRIQSYTLQLHECTINILYEYYIVGWSPNLINFKMSTRNSSPSIERQYF